jgi:hypothetical protein
MIILSLQKKKKKKKKKKTTNTNYNDPFLPFNLGWGAVTSSMTRMIK